VKEIGGSLRTSASPTSLSVYLQGMHRKEDNTMQVLYSRCCGLDVHQKVVVQISRMC
jgi:hypothetical protein